MMGFKVNKKMCKTCIFRPNSPFSIDLDRYMDEITDEKGYIKGWRICHEDASKKEVCCRGFWNCYKNNFQVGQIAQRLNLVEEVET